MLCYHMHGKNNSNTPTTTGLGHFRAQYVRKVQRLLLMKIMSWLGPPEALSSFAYKIQGVFKKNRTFAIKTLFYNILSTVPFRVVPSAGDTPFPTFLPLLERFQERTFCDGAQFSYRIFLNLRVFKKKTELFK
jgi:hypothetical protein